MPLKLYNSLTQQKEEFVPREAGKVGMYVCGVTVYDECHLGHARAAVVFDVLYRYLKYLGNDVTYVRNFTDIDDKIIKRSREAGEDWQALTRRYIQSYQQVMGRLDVQAPTHEPLATEHIHEMQELIASLETRDLAYQGGADVFYSVRKFKDYGKLSHKKIDDLEVGSRIDVNEEKEDPLDFVLWKASKPGEPQWESPWGAGRPGWHIECSAMSMKYLGPSFDIHGGGRDLIFPHHENEIAQSEGKTGQPFAKYWLHNGFVNINAEKMSKSLGNIRSMPAILEQWNPEVVRYFLLSSQYASPLDFTDKAMADSEAALVRFYETLQRLQDEPEGQESVGVDFQKILEEGLNDDLNTPHVFGRIFELIRQINRELDSGHHYDQVTKNSILQGLKKVGDVLGVFGADATEFLSQQKQRGLAASALDPAAIEKLIADRKAARSSKDWKQSDAIRDELDAHGVILKDNPDGTTTWTIKT